MIVLGAGDLPLAAVREQIISSIDLVVQVARGRGGARLVTAVHEVLPDRAPGGAPATVALTDGSTMVALPGRPPRHPDAPPASVDWIGR